MPGTALTIQTAGVLLAPARCCRGFTATNGDTKVRVYQTEATAERFRRLLRSVAPHGARRHSDGPGGCGPRLPAGAACGAVVSGGSVWLPGALRCGTVCLAGGCWVPALATVQAAPDGSEAPLQKQYRVVSGGGGGSTAAGPYPTAHNGRHTLSGPYL